MDNAFLNIVAEDLKFLREQWDQEIEPVSLRVSSSVIRKLLVEGYLHKAWGLADFGYKMIVPTYSIYPILYKATAELWPTTVHDALISEYRKTRKVDFKSLSAIIPLKNTVWFASVGGAEYHGAQIAGACIIVDQAPRTEENELLREDLDLNEFINTPCLYVFGVFINRTELIKYVTNKLGGVHYDERRTPDKLLEKKFILVDIFRETIHTKVFEARMDFFYYELLSTGQSLLKSPDVSKLDIWLENTLN